MLETDHLNKSIDDRFLASMQNIFTKILSIFKANSRKLTDIDKLMACDKIKRLSDQDKMYIYVKFRHCSLCI